MTTPAELTLRRIKDAATAQAKDETLWFVAPTVGEAYLQQSLRWLHHVIEGEDPIGFLKRITDQSEDKG